jgi:protein TonB
MFEAILERKGMVQRRIGTGAAASVALHTGALALILLFGSSATPYAHGEKDLAVKFITPTELPPPPAPPPLFASAILQAHRREHRPLRRKDTLIQSKQVPEEKPQSAESELRPESIPDQKDAQPDGALGGIAGGVAGGVLGGAAEGVPGGRLGEGLGGNILPFGEGMTRPEQTGGDPPKYTREALAAGIQGTMLVKCVITVGGTLENCRIIKALPHMERAVLDALSTWRYKPVHYQGRPVAVDYLIQIRLVIPH